MRYCGNHHHITTSPHHHITTSPHHHITTSPHHHITTSPHHHITTSPHHHITTSPDALPSADRLRKVRQHRSAARLPASARQPRQFPRALLPGHPSGDGALDEG